MIRPTYAPTLSAVLLCTLGGGYAAAPAAAAIQSAQAAEPTASAQDEKADPAGCTCTCAACLAKHGAKAQPAAQEPALPRVRLWVPDAADEPAADPVVVEVIEVAEDPAPASPAADEPEADDPAEPQRGYLGVELSEGEDGISIRRPIPESPAMKAGVEAGDVIFRVGASTITSFDELREAMQPFRPGDVVGVGLMRGGRPIELAIELGAESVMNGGTRPAVAAVEWIMPKPEDESIADVPILAEVELPMIVEEIQLPTAAPAPIEVRVDDPVIDDFGALEDVTNAEELQLDFAFSPRRGLREPSSIRIDADTITINVNGVENPGEVLGTSDRDESAELLRQIEELSAQVRELREEVEWMRRQLDRRSLK